MKLNLHVSDDEQIDMSPLIDCVFLLLIFFLVATMLKKWQMQVPVSMPDITSNLSEDPQESTLLLGIDNQGKYYRESGRTDSGFPVFDPLEDLGGYLATLPPGQALRILSERDAPFQLVIAMLDTCQHAGFQRTELKLLVNKIRTAGGR